MEDKLIIANKLSKRIGLRTILKNIDLELNRGESIAIIGESGSGKSTLLNILGLIDSFNTGELFLMGKDSTKIGNKEKLLLHRNNIGFIFQDYGLIEDITVKKNLGNSLYYKNLKKAQEADVINDTLQKYHLEYLKDSLVNSLSGGEKQRVALLKLLLKNPDIILADEPTGSLDKVNSNIVISSLLKICSQGKGLILVTHDLDIAKKMDHVIYLERSEQ
ncbi:hypothetical protein A5881_003941 [Enterococcus termitis]|nr:hypothetical protein A5881_003835 [Enterococcus termitis]